MSKGQRPAAKLSGGGRWSGCGNEHPNWVIIWLAAAGQFRAYRLSEARRADGLTAATAAGLAEQIGRAPRVRR